MSEEKQEEAKKEETKKEEKSEPQAEAKPEAKKAGKSEAAEEAAAPKPVEDKKSRIKVTKMTAEQVEKAIQTTQKNMGGLHSRFGRSLLERKEVLIRQSSAGIRKAA